MPLLALPHLLALKLYCMQRAVMRVDSHAVPSLQVDTMTSFWLAFMSERAFEVQRAVHTHALEDAYDWRSVNISVHQDYRDWFGELAPPAAAADTFCAWALWPVGVQAAALCQWQPDVETAKKRCSARALQPKAKGPLCEAGLCVNPSRHATGKKAFLGCVGLCGVNQVN